MPDGNDNRNPGLSTSMRVGGAMTIVAIALLLGVIAWGAFIYSALPERIPVHWNAAGEADSFRDRSIGWAFGPVFIALGMVVSFMLFHWHLIAGSRLVPSEREAYSLVFGYLNLSLAAIFGWISLMVWYSLDAGPWLIAVSLLAGLPVLLILGLYMPRITAERKALDRPQDLSANPDHWVLGGIFYSNPDDPRTFVPKPPHTGFGKTFNLASSGGKLMMGLLVLLMVAPVVIMILDGSG